MRVRGFMRGSLLTKFMLPTVLIVVLAMSVLGWNAIRNYQDEGRASAGY
jgi:Tfp pilus assembly protein PilX